MNPAVLEDVLQMLYTSADMRDGALLRSSGADHRPTCWCQCAAQVGHPR